MGIAATKRGRAVGGVVAAGALVMALTNCGGGTPTRSPKDVVKDYVSGLHDHDYSKACDQVTPGLQSKCNEQLPSAGVKSVDMHVGDQVISGDRAMVATTGKLCIGGQCSTYTEKTSGMPTKSKSFDEAFAAASDPDKANDLGAVVLVKHKGKWYIQLT